METQTKFALTPVAGAIATALYPSFHAHAQDDADTDSALEEIIVTATKREMSVQDIPATIQAITAESIALMGARSMEDYGRFIPSVNVVQRSSGFSAVVFRGAITGNDYIAQSTSSIYLDEMSISNTGAQPEIRMVDIARVEALSGPQGTLYGSDAQAGTLRIVTNQPVINEFEAIFDGEFRTGSDSDESYRGSLTFNLPLVEDKLALRLVGFNDKDGGFIDNVLGSTPDSWAPTNIKGDDLGLDPITDEPINPEFLRFPSGWGSLDNSAVVEEDWNDSKSTGYRASLRWELNDKWAVTLSSSSQQTDSGAYNDYDPFVGDLQTIRFHDEWREDEFDIHSLVIEADLGFAQLVSATGYYDRGIRETTDITTYAHYWAGQYCRYSYYTAIYDPRGPGFNDYYLRFNADGYEYFSTSDGTVVFWPVYCQTDTVEGDFFSAYPYTQDQRKFTQEIRLSGEGERFDWIVGFYYEQSADRWTDNFAQATNGGDGFTDSIWQGSISNQFYEFYWSRYYGTPTTYPESRAQWYAQSHTDWDQKAVFGELKWHINDQFTLTLGGRYFDRENTNYYLVHHPGGFPTAPGELPPGEVDWLNDVGDQSRETILDRCDRVGLGGTCAPEGRSGDEQEFVPKVSLSYSFGEGSMVYGLFTQGKRPGGTNRSRGEPFFPFSYEADSMDNYEIGYRSTFGGGKGRFNATVYSMQWNDYQLEVVDPSSDNCTDDMGVPDLDLQVPGVCGQVWQQVVANLGDASIDGINVEIDYAATDRFTLGMNIEFLEAETDTSHDLDGVEGEILPDGSFDPEIIGGLALPNAPEVTASAWAQYDWPVDLFGAGNQAYVRTQWSYTGESFSTLEPRPETDPNPQFKNEAYTIGDLRVGLQGDSWEVALFVNNLTDERAQYTHEDGQFTWGQGNLAENRPHVLRIYTNRPREYGVRFMKRWGD